MTLQKITIAVVDDDIHLSASLRRLLSSCGYQAEVFSSAADCLNAIAAIEAACFIIDLHLGDDSGLDLVPRLSEAGVNSQIIMMSALPDDTTEKAAKAMGCKAFLAKPFAADQPIEAIKNALSSQGLPTITSAPPNITG